MSSRRVVVAEHPGAGNHQIVHESLVVGESRFLVAFIGEQVFRLAGDSPFLGHQLAMLAHAEARARLRGGRRQWGKFRRGEAFEDAELLAEASCPRELHQALGEAPLEHDGRIARRVGADGNTAVDLPRGDLGAKAKRALQARAAGLHHGDGWSGWRERAADHRLARKVPILGVGDHGAADHLIDMRAMQRIPVDQAGERRGQHVEIGQFGIGRMRAAKGDSHPAKHRDTPHPLFLHDGLKNSLAAHAACAAVAPASCERR